MFILATVFSKRAWNGQTSNPFKRNRVLHNLIGQEEPADAQRIIRRLAISRLILSLSALLLSFFDADSARASLVTFFAAYSFYSLIVLAAIEWKPDVGFRPGTFLRSADIAWWAALSVLTGGSNGAFYVLALFILLSTAYHWGFRETAASGLLMGALIIVGNALHEYYFHPEIVRLHSDYVMQNIVPLAYILAAASLIGFVAEEIKELHAEKVAIAGVLGSIHPEAGLTPTLSKICAEMLRMFGARKMLLAAQETISGIVHLWESEPYLSREATLHLAQVDAAQNPCFFFPAPGQTWSLARPRLREAPNSSVLSLDVENRRARKTHFDLPTEFLTLHPCDFLVVHSFHPNPDWRIRLFLLDPSPAMCGTDGLCFMRTLVCQVGPAVFEVYLTRKARRRAAEMERASLARELHDGVVQSLVGIEMKLQTLRLRAEGNGAGVSGQLAEIQEYLRREIRSLRNLMQHLRRPSLGSREFIQALRIVAAQFQEDSGIVARFDSGIEEVSLSPRVCGEVVRIVQEALVNIRKHSTAESVEIRLQEGEKGYALEIRDDGAGFNFSGRLSLDQLEAEGKGPAILKERVRLIAGKLAIESIPGQGTRLEITIPRGLDES